jgi:hypothetical protein
LRAFRYRATLGSMVATNAAAAAARTRVLTRPLVGFLVLVATVVGFALWQRYPTPDLEGGLQLLADGDLDGAERDRMLRRILQQSTAAATPTVRDLWAGLLVALALGNESAFGAMQARLGASPVPLPVPEPTARTFLDLGDALVRAALFAWIAEAEAQPAVAKARWLSVRDQAVLSRRPLAHAVALAALQRLQ